MFTRESLNTELRNTDDMSRQNFCSTPSADAVDYLINTNDIETESDFNSNDFRHSRRPDNSRRETSSKRSNENSTNRSNHHSPVSTSRYRRSSPSSSRSHYHHHNENQRNRRPISSSSVSSHFHQSLRSTTSTKRPHSPPRSSSSNERTGSSSRNTRTHSNKDLRNQSNSAFPIPVDIDSKPNKILKLSDQQETEDLSAISDEESSKEHDHNLHRCPPTQEPINSDVQLIRPDSPIQSKTDSGPSNISMNDLNQTNTLAQNSTINSANDNPQSLKSSSHITDLLDIIEHINKRKNSLPPTVFDQIINDIQNQILELIRKKTELEKLSLDCQERTMKIQQLELIERGTRTQRQLSAGAESRIVGEEVPIRTEPVEQQENGKQTGKRTDKNIIVERNEINQSETLSTINSSSEPNATNAEEQKKTNDSTPTLVPVKSTASKIRSSSLVIDPSIFTSRSSAVPNLYPVENDEDSSIQDLQSVTVTTIPKISAPSESTSSYIDTDFKVTTSANSFRQVQYQSGIHDKSNNSKGSTPDLRLILTNQTTKSSSVEESDEDFSNRSPDAARSYNEDEQKITINQSRTRLAPDQIQGSFHEEPPRNSKSKDSFTINSMESRNHHRYNNGQRHPRLPHYSNRGSSSSPGHQHERSYSYGASHSSRYGSNQKRHNHEDLRSQLGDGNHSKSSRGTYRNN